MRGIPVSQSLHSYTSKRLTNSPQAIPVVPTVLIYYTNLFKYTTYSQNCQYQIYAYIPPLNEWVLRFSPIKISFLKFSFYVFCASKNLFNLSPCTDDIVRACQICACWCRLTDTPYDTSRIRSTYIDR